MALGFAGALAACGESEGDGDDSGGDGNAAGMSAGSGTGGRAGGSGGTGSGGRGGGAPAGAGGSAAAGAGGRSGASGADAAGGEAGDAGGSSSAGTAGVSGSAGAAPSEGVIPADRLIEWRGNVGVEGGIPERDEEIDCTDTPYGAHADGSDTAQAIQDCLDGIEEGQVAYLPEGTYTLEAPLSLRSEKTLRGAGPGRTILLFVADLDVDVRIAGDYTDGTNGGIPILAGHEQGSTELTLSDASSFSLGDHIYVSELNDETLPVTISNDNGECDYCGIYGANGARARLQLAEVVGVDGDRVTIAPPLYFTLSSRNSPEALRTPRYVEYAGLENLAVVNDGDAYQSRRKPIEFQGAANSWVRNVRVERCGERCIDLWFDVFRNEVRDSFLTGCYDRDNSDNCYGLQIEAGSANLVENVIFFETANGIMLVSASGNAFGYNYARGVHRTRDVDAWFWPDGWTHGAHSVMNLWEGNDQTALEWDYYWGSNSHNLAFRNRFRGMDATVDYDEANLVTVGAILTFPNNNYMSAVGNALGTAGFSDSYEERDYEAVSKPIWTTVSSAFGTTSDKNFTTLFRHLNYDTVTGAVKRCDDVGEPGCQGSDGSTVLPASLYLDGKPVFFGDRAFPPIGPDVAGWSNDLPAAACLDAVEDGMPFDAADCY